MSEAAENSFVGQIFLERSDGASPPVYTRICQAFDIGGIGETNQEVEVTTFCSGGTKEYIGGLADGATPTFQLRYNRANTLIRQLITDVKNKLNVDYRLVVEENDAAVEYFYFTLTPLSWELGPSIENDNTISFGGRVSGEITIEDA